MTDDARCIDFLQVAMDAYDNVPDEQPPHAAHRASMAAALEAVAAAGWGGPRAGYDAPERSAARSEILVEPGLEEISRLMWEALHQAYTFERGRRLAELRGRRYRPRDGRGLDVLSNLWGQAEAYAHLLGLGDQLAGGLADFRRSAALVAQETFRAELVEKGDEAFIVQPEDPEP